MLLLLIVIDSSLPWMKLLKEEIGKGGVGMTFYVRVSDSHRRGGAAQPPLCAAERGRVAKRRRGELKHRLIRSAMI